MTGKPEVISSSVGLIPRNALVSTNGVVRVVPPTERIPVGPVKPDGQVSPGLMNRVTTMFPRCVPVELRPLHSAPPITDSQARKAFCDEAASA
jgi:hypothetical protein